ncbi:MAG: hypothetical protein IJJ85_11795 [Clostridia bacterium]|nr:hypothetical protein [Clostridia bacterium]
MEEKTENKTASGLKDPLFLRLLIAVVLAAGGILLYIKAFPAWNVPLYFLSVGLMAAGAGFAIAAVTGRTPAKAALKPALFGAAGFLILAFGTVFLVNNVLLQAKQASKAATIMSVVFSVLFLALAAAALLRAKRPAAHKALALALAAALLVPGVWLGIQPLLPETFEHPFTDKIKVTEGTAMASDKDRLLINADDSHWWGFWNSLAEEGKFDEESLNAYVMNYADSGVTDLLFNVFCQTSDTPSDVMTFRGDLYGETEQNGNPVDYGNYRGLHAFYNEHNVDIFAVWIEKCRETGIRPWLTLRMNDCHDPDESTSQLRGDLFYKAEANGWTVGDEYGYYRHCFNYAVPEIRQLMLDYTKEQLLRYDVDALELDFMREIYCFDYLHTDNDTIVGIMNDYMRETAKIVQEAEKKWGHDIELSVRLMRDLDQCKAYGFDPLTWCKEGLVDSITVTPRFSSNDSAMPIADWKARCPEIEIYAGVETLVNTNAKGCCASAEVVRGYGAQYLTAGADGLYLFNYMTSPPGVGEREKEVYDTCGSLTEILKHSRRHVVTYQDTVPAGWEPYRPLPMKLKSGCTAALAVETGVIPKGSEVSVYLGLSKEVADGKLTLSVSGRETEYKGRDMVYGRAESGGEDVELGYCEAGDAFVYKFTLSDAENLPNLLTLEISNGDRACNLVYAEIKVEP